MALETARLHRDRLHTLVLSGILLFPDELFEMYEDLSLRFYRGDDAAFELYTHYMYEKIFGEAFVRRVGRDALEPMRRRFHDRWVDHRHSLVRLTQAQDPFFAAVEENLPAYRAANAPTLILAGAQDRTIPPWVQRKFAGVLPDCRYEQIPDCGHVAYLEAPETFFEQLRGWAAESTGVSAAVELGRRGGKARAEKGSEEGRSEEERSEEERSEEERSEAARPAAEAGWNREASRDK